MSILGRDPAAIALARFGDRVQSGTLTRRVTGAYNGADPAGAPATTSTDYAVKGLAFRYEQLSPPGERVRRGEYLVTLLRGSLDPAAGLPEPGDRLLFPPPDETSAKVGYVAAVENVTPAGITLAVRGQPVG